MTDILHAPFYARLPSLPALSPSRHLRYAPMCATSAPKSTRSGSNPPSSLSAKKLVVRPPSAKMIQENPHRRATHFYDGKTVVIPHVQETIKLPTRTKHIKAQEAFLKQAEQIKGQYSPSQIRTSRSIMAELLPSALMECCKDEPCYVYLLSELAKAIERHKGGLKPAQPPEPSAISATTRIVQDTKESTRDDIERVDDALEMSDEAHGGEPDIRGTMTGDVVSLAKLVAKKEIEAKTYRRRMDHMKTTLTKLNREIQIAKTTIGALNAEILRLESIHKIATEARAPGTLKDRMINLNKTTQMILQSE